MTQINPGLMGATQMEMNPERSILIHTGIGILRPERLVARLRAEEPDSKRSHVMRVGASRSRKSATSNLNISVIGPPPTAKVRLSGATQPPPKPD